MPTWYNGCSSRTGRPVETEGASILATRAGRARRSRLGALALLIALAAVPACGDGSSTTDTRLTIGLVTNNPNGLRNVAGFVEGMEQLGYVAGDDVDYLYAGEPLTGEELERELDRFIGAPADLVFTAGTPTGVAAHRVLEDTGIPIVFGVIADPLAAGVMEDLNQPGGTMTGVKLGQDQPRRLELLLEIAPAVETNFVPYTPDDAAASSAVAQVSAVAGDLAVELVRAEARSNEEVSEIIEGIPPWVDAIFLVPDSTVNARLPDILARADELRLPTSGPSTAQVEEGALTTYGFVHERAGAQAARMADQVLRGADPGDLPVEDTESFLGINLTTAERIGLEIGDAVVQQADLIVRPDGVAEDLE